MDIKHSDQPTSLRRPPVHIQRSSFHDNRDVHHPSLPFPPPSLDAPPFSFAYIPRLKTRTHTELPPFAPTASHLQWRSDDASTRWLGVEEMALRALRVVVVVVRGYIQLQHGHLKILRQPFSPPQLGPVYSVRMLGFSLSWQLPGSYNAENVNSY